MGSGLSRWLPQYDEILHGGQIEVTISGKWMRLSEHLNALDYLEKAFEFIRLADKDEMAWKWVTIALHGALYGFAICALEQGNFENVLKRNKKGEIIRDIKGDPKLIDFWKTLNRCQDPNVMGGASVLKLTPDQLRSISLLTKKLRNVFMHFIPTGSSIEIHGMPHIALDTLNAIRFLALETRTAIHLNDGQKDNVKLWCESSERTLQCSRLYKEAESATEESSG